jgi:hypothetical protein
VTIAREQKKQKSLKHRISRLVGSTIGPGFRLVISIRGVKPSPALETKKG